MKNLVFVFPLFLGVVCVQGKNLVQSSVVKNTGAIKISSARRDGFLSNFFCIPLLRGLEFLWLALRVYGNIFWNWIKNFDTKKIFFQKNKIKNIIFLIFLIIFAIILIFFVAWWVLGALPVKLAFWLVPNPQSIFLQRIFVGVIFVVLTFGLMLVLRIFPAIKTFLRFNTAGNVAVHGKKICGLSFLNVLFGSLLLSNFVICLLGVSVPYFVGVLLRMFCWLVVFCAVFEFELFVAQKSQGVQKFWLGLGVLFFAKPGRTEQQVADGAFMECELMKNDEREVVDSLTTLSQIDIAFVLSEVRSALKKAGIEEFGETEWLVAGVLNVKKLDLVFVKSLNEKQYKLVQNAVERRIKNEPLDKIFGFKDFYGLRFKVNKYVLSPRQETEILVENVLLEIGDGAPKVLDLCTGSGAIAVCVAKNSLAKVLATDISDKALEIAKENAKHCGADVKFRQADMFSGLFHKKFDIIVSNPPYIKTDEIALLDKEVKNFDPTLALDGGADGLYFYKIIASLAPSFLTSKGKLFLEIGSKQAQKVKKLLTEGFEDIKILRDYNGLQRIVVATKKD